MTRSTRRLVCGLLLAGGSLVATAHAADPGSGEVSAAAPKVTWTGSTTAGYIQRMPTAVSGREDTPCDAPFCDEFALKVSTSANLTVAQALGSESETAALTLRIIKPDGSVVQANSDPGAAAGGKYFKLLVKNAPTGDYTVQHYNNSSGAMTYDSYAELAIAGAAPAPTPTPAPGGGGSGGGGGGGGEPAPVEAIDVSVKVGKLSARKLKRSRKLSATVTVSRPVTSIGAALAKGSKTIGKGTRGATSGTAKVVVKIAKKTARKLKKGTYTLTVVASDGTTATTKTLKLKVRK